MASVNGPATIERPLTHGGARAAQHVSAKEQLWRSVGANLLFEDQYYETGQAVASRLVDLVRQNTPEDVAEIAVMARGPLKLRHTPLWLAASLASESLTRPIPSYLVSETITAVIQRADELAEFLSMYWKLLGHAQKEGQVGTAGKRLPARVRRGLARAFPKFDAYQLAKWDRADTIRLRDVLRLVHPKPADAAQSALWQQLATGTLPTPHTWEVALSGGADKKTAWMNLLVARKLGYQALLMNLRNMLDVGVGRSLVVQALLDGAPRSRVLPFQFVSAARACPALEDVLSEALALSLKDAPKLAGHTLLLIDVSGSMSGQISGKSKLTRFDAAAALAALTVGVCEQVTVYATAGGMQTHKTRQLPPRAGLAMLDAVEKAAKSLGGGGIFLKQALDFIQQDQPGRTFDRVLVFTDEQDTDRKANPKQAVRLGRHNYIMNVAAYSHGIASDAGWERLTGFSERCLDWLAFNEQPVVLG